jgi:hypothetical protein
VGEAARADKDNESGPGTARQQEYMATKEFLWFPPKREEKEKKEEKLRRRGIGEGSRDGETKNLKKKQGRMLRCFHSHTFSQCSVVQCCMRQVRQKKWPIGRY